MQEEREGRQAEMKQKQELPICTEENIKVANGSVFMGKPLFDMSNTELMCCIVEMIKSARQDRLDRASEIV
jgi:hypothetical protein